MATLETHSSDAFRSWFLRSGGEGELRACIGPLPSSGAVITRWVGAGSDWMIRTIDPHPDCYRISVTLEPMESQIWSGDQVIWANLIAANRFRICAPGNANRWRRLSGCDIVNLFIPVGTVQRLTGEGGDGLSQSLAPTMFMPDRQVLALVRQMLEAEAMAGPLSHLFCDGLVTALLSYLLKHYAQPALGVEAGRLGSGRVRRVTSYITQHLADDIPIATLADLCSMSEAHFSREFRRSVGLPPYQYVMKLRLERASQALVGSAQPIVDIAGECGFNNASHFSRTFASRYGVSPGSYRREHRCSSV